jgi:hypothetical protein
MLNYIFGKDAVSKGKYFEFSLQALRLCEK